MIVYEERYGVEMELEVLWPRKVRLVSGCVEVLMRSARR